MALAKLRNGFVQVSSQSGLHYVKPKFWERLRLVWIFRNFSMLPRQVLNESQQRFMSTVCAQDRMFQCWGPNEQERAQLIGTLLMSVFPADPTRRRLYPYIPAPFDISHTGRNQGSGQPMHKELD
jgi:hypothetical protein